LFRRCLRRLRHICGHHNVLPSSHIISDGLEKTGDGPVAYGGFTDVWEGLLGGEKVCVKVMRVCGTNTDNQEEPMTVRDVREPLVCSNVTNTFQVFLWRSSCLEETETSKCCAFLGRYVIDEAATTCLGVDV